MIVTRKDAVRIIRQQVPDLSAADRIRIPYKGCQCYITGIRPLTDFAGVAVQKVSPDRHSAVRVGRLLRSGIIEWNAEF